LDLSILKFKFNVVFLIPFSLTWQKTFKWATTCSFPFLYRVARNHHLPVWHHWSLMQEFTVPGLWNTGLHLFHYQQCKMFSTFPNTVNSAS
jgi:hypothetical protein